MLLAGHQDVDAVTGGVAALLAAPNGARHAPARQLVERLAAAGVPHDVAAAVLALTLQTPPIPGGVALAVELADRPRPRARGTRRRTQVTNLVRRGAYLLAAGRRVAAAVTTAMLRGPAASDDPAEPTAQDVAAGDDPDGTDGAPGEGRLAALRDAIAAETPNWLQHVTASRNRAAAAELVDAATDRYGQLLGWNAVLDERTTPECRAADGRNFYADAPPSIGAPGTVHGFCRCTAGAPHAGADLVDGGGNADVIAAAAGPRAAVELTARVAAALDGPRLTRSDALAQLRRLAPADRRRVLARVVAARRTATRRES